MNAGPGNHDAGAGSCRRGERDGIAALVDDGDVRGPANDDGTLLEQPREPAAAERALESVLARSRLLAHDAREGVDRPRTSGAAGIVEETEAVRDQDSARTRRWVGEVLVPAELRRDRPPPDHAVLLQVTLGDATAAGANVLDRRPEQVPPGQCPVRTMRLLEAERGARNRTRGRADPEHLGRPAGEVDVHLLHLPRRGAMEAEPGHRHEEVEHPRRAVAG